MNKRRMLRQIRNLRNEFRHALQEPNKRSNIAKKLGLYLLIRLMLFVPSSAGEIQQKREISYLEQQVKHQQEITMETAQRIDKLAYNIEKELEKSNL